MSEGTDFLDLQQQLGPQGSREPAGHTRLEAQMSIWRQGRGRGRGRERRGGRRDGTCLLLRSTRRPQEMQTRAAACTTTCSTGSFNLSLPWALSPASHPWEVCPSQSSFLSPRRAAQASIHRWLPVTPGV